MTPEAQRWMTPEAFAAQVTLAWVTALTCASFQPAPRPSLHELN